MNNQKSGSTSKKGVSSQKAKAGSLSHKSKDSKSSKS